MSKTRALTYVRTGKYVYSQSPRPAYLAGLIDGEGTVTLSRKHAGDMRQLVVSISNTELRILEFVMLTVGAGKLTRKRSSRTHHAPSYAYAVWNRQALALLAHVEPYMTSYKRERARLALRDCVRLTPRNGKYTEPILAERSLFETALLGMHATAIKKPLQPSG